MTSQPSRRLRAARAGTPDAVAGGVAILLFIIVLLVVSAVALALYGTGGFVWLRRTGPHDRADH
jgi:hypothetical protein